MPKVKKSRTRVRISPNQVAHSLPDRKTFSCTCCGVPGLFNTPLYVNRHRLVCCACSDIICDSCSLRDADGGVYCTYCPVFDDKPTRLALMRTCCRLRSEGTLGWVTLWQSDGLDTSCVKLHSSKEAAIVWMHEQATCLTGEAEAQSELKDYKCVYEASPDGTCITLKFPDTTLELHKIENT